MQLFWVYEQFSVCMYFIQSMYAEKKNDARRRLFFAIATLVRPCVIKVDPVQSGLVPPSV